MSFFAPAEWIEWIFLAGAMAISVAGFWRACGRGFGLAAGVGGVLLGFIFIGHVAIPLAITVVALTVWVQSARGRDLRQDPRDFGLQMLYVLAGLATYTAARAIIESGADEAMANAQTIIDFEKSLGLFFEPDLQAWVLKSESVTRIFNGIYSFFFLAVVGAVLLWLYIVNRAEFKVMRNALGVSTLLAVATIAVFPVAPPRLMPDSGILDTVVLLGREHAFANEYAAVPSLHVGWMVLTGYMLARTIGGRTGRLVGLIPGSVMAVTVIVTGNHWWVDGVVGTWFSVLPAMAWGRSAWARSTLRMLQSNAIAIASVVSHTVRIQLMLLSMLGLLTYLLTAQMFTPGFTAFWGYLVFQVIGIIILLLAAEIVFRKQGGLSWQTHVIAVVCTYLDVLGTDGDLYARIDEYDKITHFMGVAAITSAAYDCFRCMYLRGNRSWVAEDRLVAAVTVGVAIGVAWEVYEYIGDTVFNTSRIGGVADTTNDIISDTLGAMIAGIILWRAERVSGRNREPEADRARDPAGGQ